MRTNALHKGKRQLFKRMVLVLCFFGVARCDDPEAPDCFKTAGPEIEKTIQLPEFSSVIVNREITSFIQQGDSYTVRIVTGENLMDEVSAIVKDGTLVLTDDNQCNWVRDYGITKVFITAPDLKEFRTSSQFDVSSIGTLNYPQFKIVSEDFDKPDIFAVGDFRIQINADELSVVANKSSSFFLEGQVRNLYVGFFDGVGRFEGAALIGEHIEISHRGSNDMVINPQESLRGLIRGTGNVISVNRPPQVEVEELYTGRLIFTD